MSNEDLEKQAQQLLSDARKLIRQAGDLAKEGQFSLHFGEIGTFTPKSAWNLEAHRELATKYAMEDGKRGGWNQAEGSYSYTPWAELTDDEREILVMGHMRDLRNEQIPHELAEYGDESDGDKWWAPSRC